MAQFETLRRHKVRHVVLSAFGCGVFKNNPRLVADMYRDAILCYKESLSAVVFAIHAGGDDNYRIFAEVLREKGFLTALEAPTHRALSGPLSADGA